jgi:hypothetical protein
MCKVLGGLQAHLAGVVTYPLFSSNVGVATIRCAAGAMRDEAFVEKANGFGGKVQRTFSGMPQSHACTE